MLVSHGPLNMLNTHIILASLPTNSLTHLFLRTNIDPFAIWNFISRCKCLVSLWWESAEGVILPDRPIHLPALECLDLMLDLTVTQLQMIIAPKLHTLVVTSEASLEIGLPMLPALRKSEVGFMFDFIEGWLSSTLRSHPLLEEVVLHHPWEEYVRDLAILHNSTDDSGVVVCPKLRMLILDLTNHEHFDNMRFFDGPISRFLGELINVRLEKNKVWPIHTTVRFDPTSDCERRLPLLVGVVDRHPEFLSRVSWAPKSTTFDIAHRRFCRLDLW